MVATCNDYIEDRMKVGSQLGYRRSSAPVGMKRVSRGGLKRTTKTNSIGSAGGDRTNWCDGRSFMLGIDIVTVVLRAPVSMVGLEGCFSHHLTWAFAPELLRLTCMLSPSVPLLWFSTNLETLVFPSLFVPQLYFLQWRA